jgi:hypothetical protein
MPDPVVEIVTPEYRNVEVYTLDQDGYYRMTNHNETNNSPNRKSGGSFPPLAGEET